MKLSHLIITSALTVMAVGAAHADTYIGVEGTAATVDDANQNELEPNGLRMRLGTRIDETFDLEAQLGFMGQAEANELDVAFAGIYLKGYAPVGNNSALFALGGFTSATLTEGPVNNRSSDSRVGFSYGVGLETQLSENVDLTADYMNYIAEDGAFENLSAVSFGIKLYF